MYIESHWNKTSSEETGAEFAPKQRWCTCAAHHTPGTPPGDEAREAHFKDLQPEISVSSAFFAERSPEEV